MFADGGGGVDGVDVESVPALGAGGPSEGTANPIAATSFGVGVGSYKGGALVASDNDGAKWTTYVSYAETLVGLSGDVLLTQQVGGAEAYKVRLFTGTAFGPAHVVPGTGAAAGWRSAAATTSRSGSTRCSGRRASPSPSSRR